MPSTTMARRGWRRSSAGRRAGARCGSPRDATRIELTARPASASGRRTWRWFGIGGERLAAEAVAPGFVLPPGRAVGAAGAVAAGAGGIDRGAAGKFFSNT